MSTEAELRSRGEISVENIGGIEHTSVSFGSGVTLLVGRNATNRTSLLQAMMAGCGSDEMSLKADADEAHVELTIGEKTYTRHLHRQNGSVIVEGDPILDEPAEADLFAFLIGSNEARRAVDRSTGLRDLVMRPVDTDAIKAEIDRLNDAKRDVESELEELDTLESRLPKLENKRDRLVDEIESVEADLAEATSELEDREADPEATQDEEAKLEDRLSALRDTRDTLEDVRYDIETEEGVIENLRSEREELSERAGDLPAPDEERIPDLEAEIERLHDRKRTLETEIDELQSVIEFNERMVEEGQSSVVEALADTGVESSGAVTDRLLAEESTTCWTCGSEVTVEAIQSTLDELREVNETRFGRIEEIETELDEYRSSLEEIRQRKTERREVEQRLEEIAADLEDRTDRLEELETKRETLEEEVSEQEAEVEALEDAVQTEVLDLHREANELEFELDKLERQREEVIEEIAELQDRLDERSALEERREGIQTELETQRTKIERLDSQVIQAFNDHMDVLLDRLAYDNIERIWLERRETEAREGRRTVTKPVFDLHVVRRSAEGTTFEDTIDHLSESERELTGLVFALAGYLAHEVHEQLPIMLLDSLDPIDAERIETLVEYLADYADYLIVALLEEDAAVFDDNVERITDI